MNIENTKHQSGGGETVSSPEALGQSEAFLDFQDRLSRVAPIDRSVLILGERGTGKELAASKIHFLSNRWQGPLVTLNCSALTSTLIGSELFGYEKGAFTGATAKHAGRFETASGGTLFLDEIGNIPMEVQEKILRVVEYGSFERVGGSHSIQVNVRIIAATNVDLAEMARQGEFKQDLLDRLSFEVIYVPPLRKRFGDVMFLTNHFAQRMAFELGWEDIPEFSEEATRALESYRWEGNIRELKNVIERAVYRSDSHIIHDIIFNPFKTPYKKKEATLKNEGHTDSGNAVAVAIDSFTDKPVKEAVQELEIFMIRKTLKECKYNQKKAAKLLGLSYDQFRGMRRKYDSLI